MTNLWAPNAFLIRHIYSGYYGAPQEISPFMRIGLSAATILSISFVLILAVFGFAGAKVDFFFLSVLCYLVLTVAMISLTVSLSRYRVPVMPFLMIFAAHFLANPDARKAIGVSDTRLRIVLVSSLTLLSLWAYRLPSIILSLW
jgi:hypothetical protein